jgi:hypothetical protein
MVTSVALLLAVVAGVGRVSAMSNAPYNTPGPSSYELMDYNPVADVSRLLDRVWHVCICLLCVLPIQWLWQIALLALAMRLAPCARAAAARHVSCVRQIPPTATAWLIKGFCPRSCSVIMHLKSRP